MVLLAPTVTAFQTLLEVYVAHMLHLMRLYTTQRKQYVCWSDQSNHRVGTQQVRLGNEELSFVEEFRFLGHIMTADCRDDNDVKK